MAFSRINQFYCEVEWTKLKERTYHWCFFDPHRRL